MKHSTLLVTGALACVIGLAGCTTHETAMIVDDDRVYLTTLGLAVPEAPQPRRLYRLGAGDALGQAVFARYVAFVRAQEDAAAWANVSTSESDAE